MLSFAVIIVLSNAEDATKLVMEAERQGLMNGEYVFLLVQQFEVSGNVVSNLQETRIKLGASLFVQCLNIVSERHVMISMK